MLLQVQCISRHNESWSTKPNCNSFLLSTVPILSTIVTAYTCIEQTGVKQAFTDIFLIIFLSIEDTITVQAPLHRSFVPQRNRFSRKYFKRVHFGSGFLLVICNIYI